MNWLRLVPLVYLSTLLLADGSWAMSAHEHMLHLLVNITLLPPAAPINPKCTRPVFKTEKPQCAGSAFTGALLPKRRRIFSFFLMGFEVDTLEILFREQVEFVDLFCLVESTRAHWNQTAKPLVWERLKWTERFAFVHDKVVHIVCDDRSVSSLDHHGNMWKMEASQSKEGAEMCLQAIRHRFGFHPDDALLSGNADEVVAAYPLWQLQWCALVNPVVTAAIWMPAGGDLNRAVRTDHRPDYYRHGLCTPTIFTMRAINASGLCTEKCYDGVRLLAGEYRNLVVPGGAHLTWVPFMPHVYIKELTATEYEGGNQGGRFWLNQIRIGVLNNKLDELQLWIPDHLYGFKYTPLAMVPVHELVLVQPPWFLKCNPDRFPYWFRKPDPRNAALRAALLQLDEEIFGQHGYPADVRQKFAAETVPSRPRVESLPSPSVVEIAAIENNTEVGGTSSSALLAAPAVRRVAVAVAPEAALRLEKDAEPEWAALLTPISAVMLLLVGFVAGRFFRFRRG